MSRRLRRLKLRAVALVDAGANPGAFISLFKSESKEAPEVNPASQAERSKRLEERIAEIERQVRRKGKGMLALLDQEPAEAVSVRKAEPTDWELREHVKKMRRDFPNLPESQIVSLAKQRQAAVAEEVAKRSERQSPPRREAVNLGNLIRKRRTALGLTQEQIAKSADMTQAALSKIESGGTELPNTRTLSALMEAGLVDLADLKAAGIYRGPLPQ